MLAGRDGLSLDGGELFNGDGGRLDSQNSLSVSLGGVLDNQGGALVSEGPERAPRAWTTVAEPSPAPVRWR